MLYIEAKDSSTLWEKIHTSEVWKRPWGKTNCFYTRILPYSVVWGRNTVSWNQKPHNLRPFCIWSLRIVPHYKKRFILVKYGKDRERRRIVFWYAWMAIFFVLGFYQTALFEAGMQFSSGIKNRVTQGLAVYLFYTLFPLWPLLESLSKSLRLANESVMS